MAPTPWLSGGPLQPLRLEPQVPWSRTQSGCMLQSGLAMASQDGGSAAPDKCHLSLPVSPHLCPRCCASLSVTWVPGNVSHLQGKRDMSIFDLRGGWGSQSALGALYKDISSQILSPSYSRSRPEAPGVLELSLGHSLGRPELWRLHVSCLLVSWQKLQFKFSVLIHPFIHPVVHQAGTCFMPSLDYLCMCTQT